jgi:hypothetical protein
VAPIVSVVLPPDPAFPGVVAIPPEPADPIEIVYAVDAVNPVMNKIPPPPAPPPELEAPVAANPPPPPPPAIKVNLKVFSGVIVEAVVKAVPEIMNDPPLLGAVPTLVGKTPYCTFKFRSHDNTNYRLAPLYLELQN